MADARRGGLMTDIEAQPPATDPSASQPTPAPIGQRAVSDAEAPREKHPQCRLGCTFAATPAGPCAGGTCAMAWATEGNAAPPGLGTPRSEAVTGPVGELPEDAIEAAAKALAAQEGDDYDGSIYGADPAVLFVWGDHARVALAAALPFLERATRDKIAAEIEAASAKFFVEARRDGYRSAARVARGGEATE